MPAGPIGQGGPYISTLLRSKLCGWDVLAGVAGLPNGGYPLYQERKRRRKSNKQVARDRTVTSEPLYSGLPACAACLAWSVSGIHDRAERASQSPPFRYVHQISQGGPIVISPLSS